MLNASAPERYPTWAAVTGTGPPVTASITPASGISDRKPQADSCIEVIDGATRRVARSRTASPATASSAQSEAGSNPLRPGRMMTSTPRKPTRIAVQRRQPTVSPRNTAAPKVTASGMA